MLSDFISLVSQAISPQGGSVTWNLRHPLERLGNTSPGTQTHFGRASHVPSQPGLTPDFVLNLAYPTMPTADALPGATTFSFTCSLFQCLAAAIQR